MQLRRTKTFAENRWYRRESPSVFVEVSREETKEESLSLDAQVNEWVNKTGYLIIHPGQLGMHTAWHGSKEDPYQLKCVTLGLTVLYVEPQNAGQQQTDAALRNGPIPHADCTGEGVDPGNATAGSGTVQAGAWGNGGSATDGRGSEEEEGRRAVPVSTAEEDAATPAVDAAETEASGST